MRLTIVPLFVILLMSGCGGSASEADLVGFWSGELGMSLQTLANEVEDGNEQSAFKNEQESQGKRLSLELREDGTLTFTAISTIEGTWSLDGSTVVMELPSAEKTFTGTYRLELEGVDKMSGKDPRIEGVTLKFSR